MPIGSPLAVVAAQLELESPRVEQRLQRDFGSGLIPNLDHEGEDEGDDGEDNFDGCEEKNSAGGDADHGIEEDELDGSLQYRTGFWGPLVMVAGVEEINHIEHFFSSLPNQSEKQVCFNSDLSTNF